MKKLVIIFVVLLSATVLFAEPVSKRWGGNDYDGYGPERPYAQRSQPPYMQNPRPQPPIIVPPYVQPYGPYYRPLPPRFGGTPYQYRAPRQPNFNFQFRGPYGRGFGFGW